MAQQSNLRRLPLVVLALTLLAIASIAVPVDAKSIAIVGGMLVDGNSGQPVHDSVVLIEGEKIVAVGTRRTVEVPADAEVIRAGGMTVMPGLFNTHVHLTLVGHGKYEEYFSKYAQRMRRDIMPVSARELLMHGVTSARDLGSNLEDILEVRDRINRGEIPGPRMSICGPILQKTLPADQKAQAVLRWTIDGPEDARQKVRKLVSAGVDLIKVVQTEQMTREELTAVIDEAHKAGKAVSTHGVSDAEIQLVVRAGADSVEHVGLAPAAVPYSQETIDLLIAKGPWVVPTAIASWSRKLTQDFPERRFNQEMEKDYPPDLVEDIEDSLSDFTSGGSFNQALPFRWQQLIKSGARILVGTDSGTAVNFHTDSTWREMQVLVDNGMSPLQAIAAAARFPAKMMRQDHLLGTIEPGKLADVIVVQGNVLEYMSNLQNVVHVIKGGKIYK